MFEQGKVKSLSVSLLNFDSTRNLNISNLVEEVNIIEDIFESTLYGTIAIIDGVNLINGVKDKELNFPIVGEEFVNIKYTIDWMPEPVSISLRFFVYGISQIEYSKNSTSKRYILKICSEENFIDSTRIVQKGYTAQHSDNVKNLLKEYMFIAPPDGNPKEFDNLPYTGRKSKKLVVSQPTRGIQNVCIPRLTPIQAANFLAKRSISEDVFTSGSYLFFENFEGFHFCDIEYLIRAGINKADTAEAESKKTGNYLNDFTYYFENPLIASDEYRGQKTIIRMTQKNLFDTIEKLKYGMFQSNILVYDYINKRNISTAFNFLNSGVNDQGQKTNSSTMALGGSDGKSYPENSVSFLDRISSFPFESTRFFVIPKDLSTNDTFLDQIYSNRTSFFTRLSQNIFTLDTLGNPNLNAGDVIFINVPSGDGLNEADSKNNKFLSGYYLACSISHVITRTTYLTKIDAYKNAFSAKLESTEEAINTKVMPENNKQKSIDYALERANIPNVVPGEKLDIADFFKRLNPGP